MRYQGTLQAWNDERGFGFVQVDEGGEPVFVHISAFQPRPVPASRPTVGQRLEFAIGMEGGKKRALQVAWRKLPQTPSAAAGRAQRRHGKVAGAGSTYFVILAFALLFAGVAVLWGVQRAVPLWYAVLSVLTYAAYGYDKAAARAGHWRTAESRLHLMALLGGWPGAMLAQQRLRHKSRKAEFLAVFWVTVVLNVGAFVFLHSPWGRHWLPILPF